MQRSRKKLFYTLGISFLIGLLGILLNFLGFVPLLRLESFTKDLRAILGRKTPVDRDLVLLTIDEASLRLDGVMHDELRSEPVFSEMQKGWPWPRSVHAALLEKLVNAGARVVAFDLLFLGPGNGDAPFSAALAKHRERTLVSGTFDGTDTSRPSFARPSATLITPGLDDGMIGFANFIPDADGVVRAAMFQAAPEDFAGRSRLADPVVFDSLAAGVLRKTDPKIKLPTGQNVPFRFSGAPGTYVHHSLYEVFTPRLWQRNFKNGAFFKNKIVIIGPEGRWSHDEHPTPFGATLGTGGLMAGPEIHLQAMAAARAGEFLHLPGAGLAALVIAMAACLGAFLNQTLGKPMLRIGVFFLVVAVFWFGAQWIFNSSGWILPVAAPVLVLALTVLGGLLLDFSRERVERLRIRATLERYVSSHVAREILDSPGGYLTSLVGVRKEVTVLFADLRNFTAMVNTLNAQDLVAQLNEYYARVIEDVFANSGTLDKIMGDGMMVVWGNLQSAGPAQDAVHAVRTALAIQASLATLNARWAAEGRPQLALGIGIAQGECVVGNIGSEKKMDLTVIGDAANLAARLQALTRENEEVVLIGSRVAELVGEEFSVPAITTLAIRGFEKPVTVHSVRAL